MTRNRPDFVSYCYRTLPYCLELLLGLRELRGIANLLSQLVSLSCVMNTKMCLLNQ